MRPKFNVTVTVGLGHDKSGAAVLPERAAAVTKAAEYAFAKLAGGCTLTFGVGSWFNPETGELVRESVAVFTVLCEDLQLEVIRLAAGNLRDGLNQSCVAFTFSPATVEFI